MDWNLEMLEECTGVMGERDQQLDCWEDGEKVDLQFSHLLEMEKGAKKEFWSLPSAEDVLFETEMPPQEDQHPEEILGSTSPTTSCSSQLKKVEEEPFFSKRKESSQDSARETKPPKTQDEMRLARWHARQRLNEKKRRRSFSKKILYHKRKIVADSRPRVMGRFVKKGAATS